MSIEKIIDLLIDTIKLIIIVIGVETKWRNKMTRQEFIEEIGGRNFVAFDANPFVNAYLDGVNEVNEIEDAHVYKGDFECDQEFESYNKRGDVKVIILD